MAISSTLIHSSGTAKLERYHDMETSLRTLSELPSAPRTVVQSMSISLDRSDVKLFLNDSSLSPLLRILACSGDTKYGCFISREATSDVLEQKKKQRNVGRQRIKDQVHNSSNNYQCVSKSSNNTEVSGV